MLFQRPMLLTSVQRDTKSRSIEVCKREKRIPKSLGKCVLVCLLVCLFVLREIKQNQSTNQSIITFTFSEGAASSPNR